MQTNLFYDGPPIESRLIISIYDATGNWPKYYIEAGYPVILWDLKYEGCILRHFDRLLQQIDVAMEAGYIPYGILSATPCTDFTGSGARWWKEKDSSRSYQDPYGDFDNSVELHQCLADVVLMLVERFKDTLKFWAQENPKGRLEKLLPHFKQYRQMSFNPCDYGDPYTKLTVLWGEFNKNLPKNPVPATEGSKMHMKVRSAAGRSETPLGFAKSFFIANP